ncbi:hypothetical protein SLE2022_363000 [Rubroshorea leprosula]
MRHFCPALLVFTTITMFFLTHATFIRCRPLPSSVKNEEIISHEIVGQVELDRTASSLGSAEDNPSRVLSETDDDRAFTLTAGPSRKGSGHK